MDSEVAAALREHAQVNPAGSLGWWYFHKLVREDKAGEALVNATRALSAKNRLMENEPMLVALAAADRIAKAMPVEIRKALDEAEDRMLRAKEELDAASNLYKGALKAEETWLRSVLAGAVG